MSDNNEQPQVSLSLMDESEHSSSDKVKRNLKIRRPRKSYFSEEYIVGYGVPVLIIILLLVFFVLIFIAIQRYNKNCVPSKEKSCRGIIWYFT